MRKTLSKQTECPCCSWKTYSNCCQQYHRNVIPENALLLMRSRSFVAHLSKDGTDLTFSERSRFIRDTAMWKYLDGKISKGVLTAEE